MSTPVEANSRTIVDIRLRPQCCPLVSHFEFLAVYQTLAASIVSHLEYTPLLDCLDYAWPYYEQISRHPQNRKYITYRNVARRANRATAISNVNRKFDEVWTFGF